VTGVQTCALPICGSFDASVEIVSASLTFRWGGPHEITPVAGKEVAGYRK